MERHTTTRPLLWVGVAGLLLTILFTIFWGPHSAARIDARVQAAAEAALANEEFSWAQASAHGQRVVLEGVAPSEGARSAATQAVLTSLGSGGLFAGGVTKVSSFSVDVAPVLSPFRWVATKSSGALVLEGVAPSRASRAAIEGAARTMFGVAVESRLTLASGAPRGVIWELGAIQGLEALQDLDTGTAELLHDRLTVTGVAPTDRVVMDIRDALGRGVGGVTALSEVVGPAEWTATLANGRLTFGGRVPTADAQQALAAAVGANHAGVFEDMASIGGAGDWQGRAIAALPQFMRFLSGSISVRDKQFRISGEAPGSVLGYLREDMARITDGYAVTYDVRELAPDIAEIEGVDLDTAGETRQQACQTAFTRIMADNRILFGSSDATISRESGAVLDKLVEVARRCSDLRIEIQGHTDGTGRRANNRALSQKRADAVRAYFEAQGVQVDQLTSVGYGPDKPAASNRTERGRAQNRRIEFQVSSVEGR